MRKEYFHIIFSILALMLIAGCSTSKNTAMSRRYHAMTTKFNIAFNGNQSFKEGLENIEKANKDDYSRILNMYPISNHASASAATGNMDRTIEKCRKAIKLHSIKKKPPKDFKRYNDPKYQAFYNQNEFNPELKKAWLLLGQAELHKGDFLGASGTFSFITRFYASAPEVVTVAQLWIARAYTEMDWIYEAEDALQKVKPDKVSKENEGLYASTWANLLIKKGQHKDAIPYLQTAIEKEKDKKLRTRFNYVMAQLLERAGKRSEAAEYYSRVTKSSPPYEMDFNARIARAQLLAENPAGMERELKSMARNRNNKDYLDQIYTALGNIYLHQKDSAKAIQNYKLAVEKSVRNSIEKGVPLLILADMYFNKKDYIKAQPFYDEAAKIYTQEYDGYQRISHRAEVLGELAKENTVVVLQDSLQTLAMMPEKDRLAAINKVIEQLKKDEKEEKEENLIAQNAPDDDFSMPMPIGAIGSNDWYFYNPQTVSSGKSDFRRKWGNRKLEDNWRRGNKSAALFTENAENKNDTIKPTTNKEPENDDPDAPKFKQTTDKKSVDYYLAQIPFTEKQREKSNEQIATALYNMGFIYKDKVEDYPLAYKTFNDFQHRFGTDERVLETLYQRFLLASKENNISEANRYRNQILAQYPESKYAELLKEPNFIYRQQQMFAVQDSLYNKTYAAYTRSDYQTVFKNTEWIKKEYPLSTLLPQFGLLHALSIGRTDTPEKFEKSLNALVEDYPKSDVSAMSKDILALLKQGNVAQHGKTHGSLLTKRDAEEITPEEKAVNQFSTDKTGKHRLLLITDAEEKAINQLQYHLAIFNFSRFMIKDFGFATTKIDERRKALSVNNLASYNEGIWYINTLNTDSALVQEMDTMHVQPVIISEDNFGKLRTLFTMNDYLVFEKDSLLKDTPQYLIAKNEKVKESVKKAVQVQIADGTKQAEPKKETGVDKLFGKVKDKLNEVAEAGKETIKSVAEQVEEATEAGKEVAQTVKKATEPEKATKKEETNAQSKKTEEKQNQTAAKQPTETQSKETEKTVQAPSAPKNVKPITPKVQETTQKTTEPIRNANSGSIIIPSNENIPKTTHKPEELYKSLYFYNQNAPHYVAFYIPAGGRFDFEKIKKALDEYNNSNYKMMNLKVTLENFGKESVIFIGAFTDANVAKSYFLRVLKEPSIVQATAGMNKRNLMITAENINTMLRSNTRDVYFEFMKEYYLK